MKDYVSLNGLCGQGKTSTYPELAANAALVPLAVAGSLLDWQLRALEKEFVKEGGFTERLYRVRSEVRNCIKNK
jgi:four helix bundle suffix protein